MMKRLAYRMNVIMDKDAIMLIENKDNAYMWKKKEYCQEMYDCQNSDKNKK